MGINLCISTNYQRNPQNFHTHKMEVVKTVTYLSRFKQFPSKTFNKSDVDFWFHIWNFSCAILKRQFHKNSKTDVVTTQKEGEEQVSLFLSKNP